MDLTEKRLVVTGGAGLIGSVLSERLAVENDVLVVDDLSNGIRESVPDGVMFIESDLTDPTIVADVITPDVDAVFHLAAADKYVDTDNPRQQFETNSRMTHTILERMNEVGVSNIAFTSSCTVYGEAGEPTPEHYGPLEPISVYGATKLGEEALLSVYGHTHDFTVWTFRFANIVGPRFGAGVVPDFVEKLDEDPETLTILGNGKQQKSYMHVTECVDAMCYVVEHTDEPVNTFNLATQSTTSVDRVAEIVSEEMGLDPEYAYTGGERGWEGDVSTVLLPIDELLDLGWENERSSDDSVRMVAREIIELLE